MTLESAAVGLITGLFIVAGWFAAYYITNTRKDMDKLKSDLDETKKQVNGVVNNYITRFGDIKSDIAAMKSDVMGAIGELKVNLADNFVKKEDCGNC